MSKSPLSATPDMFGEAHKAMFSGPRPPRRRRPCATPNMFDDGGHAPRREHTPTMVEPTYSVQQRASTRAGAARESILTAGDVEATEGGASTAALWGSPDAPPIEHDRPPRRPPTPEMFEDERIAAISTQSTQAGGIDERWRQREAARQREEREAAHSELPDMIPPASNGVLGGRSPQPTTAKAARKRAAQDLADRLSCDKSLYAICAKDPERLRTMVISAADARAAAIPAGTASSDAWGFGWAMKFEFVSVKQLATSHKKMVLVAFAHLH